VVVYICGFFNVWVCGCVGGFCNVWVLCICKFLMCGCVYTWVLYCVDVCMSGFFNVWVCVSVSL